jgi:glutamyl-Q tRNA(Asp) synthetase
MNQIKSPQATKIRVLKKVLEKGSEGNTMEAVERFAPSPNGALHLGHAFSALTAFEAARAAGGRFLLRLEDLDGARCKPPLVAAIYHDLAWLGLDWERPVMRQSQRLDAYKAALDRLDDLGLLYPCYCTRTEIELAFDAPQEGIALGPDGPVYPGTCRSISKRRNEPVALRLDIRRALEVVDACMLSFCEIGDKHRGEHCLNPQDLLDHIGDIVVARKDYPASYHLAVVIDDAAQAISHVTRGEDLFSATPIHRLLQALLEMPTPIYRHHRLIRNADGKRLAKRDKDKSLAALRSEGASPTAIRKMVDL